jgi:hypothetical protein
MPDDNDPSTDDNSKTWSVTDWFMAYAAQYDDEFVINPNPPIPQAGDFILMDLLNNNAASLGLVWPPDGIPDHARSLVGYGLTSIDPQDYTNGCGTPEPIPTQEYFLLANQHCVDRKHVRWDYNLDPNINNVWYIHVIDR